MGQTVYVLMVLEGTGKKQAWRPAAVVTDLSVAEQWQQAGILQGNVDWVPLEIDDVKNIYTEEGGPRFQPQPLTSIDQRWKETAKELQEANDELRKIIEQMKKQMKGTKSVTGAVDGKTPPKPAGFAESLDNGNEIADYIEAYALYEVDHEFVAEQFRDTHATLKLLPIAQLTEGGRDQNLQNPKNEQKYQRMNVKTIPPILVSGGAPEWAKNGEVVDGNHRLRAAKKRGLTHLWAYVVNWDEEVSNGNTDTKGSNKN